MDKFCKISEHWLSPSMICIAGGSTSYQARLNEFCVYIIVLGRRRDLENNLNERPRKVLDENKLTKS